MQQGYVYYYLYFVLILNIKLTINNNKQSMFQAQSPQFSNSSKIFLSGFISPTRNKRIASVDNCCSSLQTHRNNNNNSSKKLESPGKAAQNKMRKKSQHGIGHTKNKSKQVIAEFAGLRQEFMNLKTAYKQLANQKIKQANKQANLQEQIKILGQEKQKCKRENQNLRGKVTFLETEIERIKRESIKLIQLWQFRTNRLEQNLNQKQKIITQLRNWLQHNGIAEPKSSKKEHETYRNIHHINQAEHLALLSESVIFGKYQNENKSRMSEYLSMSLNSIQQKQNEKQELRPPNLVHPKQSEVLGEIEVENYINQITNRSKDENKRTENNMKKFRKQLSKKIQVNIDDKHKDFLAQLQPKTPMDRKIPNKTNKSGKVKGKEQNSQTKSSKKKMSVKMT